MTLQTNEALGMGRPSWIGLDWEIGVLKAGLLPKNALSGTVVSGLMLPTDKK